MKRKNTLIIDVAENNLVQIKLQRESRISRVYERPLHTHASQQLLPLLEEVLQLEKIQLTDITEIRVNSKNASFTSARVVAATLNTLASILNSTVNGASQFIPEYAPSKFD